MALGSVFVLVRFSLSFVAAVEIATVSLSPTGQQSAAGRVWPSRAELGGGAGARSGFSAIASH